jgi:hypothetical protein
MIESTYRPLHELKAQFREVEQDRKKRAYDDKKLARKLARLSKAVKS